jgi:hypothetical protein
MVITYEDVTPTLIQNTTMQKRLHDGVHKVYWITPVDGYVLHDKGRDWTDIDPITGEEILYRGYTTGTASCAASYDFTANPREFYAVLAESVPPDQIFGGGNDHEIM